MPSIFCVSLDCFTLSQCVSYKISAHRAVFLAVLFSGKCPQMMHFSRDTSSSCDVELLQLAVEGEGSFNSIVQRYRVGSWKKT